MVLHCYANWWFCKRVVLDCHTICMKLFWVHQGVIYCFTHPDRFVEYWDRGLPCLRIVICCGCLKYWYCLYGIICVSVWRDVTLIACKTHDDAVGAANNCFCVWIHLHFSVDHWSSALGWYLSLSSLKSRYIAPRRWMNPCDAPQSAIFSCCASQCDE